MVARGPQPSGERSSSHSATGGQGSRPADSLPEAAVCVGHGGGGPRNARGVGFDSGFWRREGGELRSRLLGTAPMGRAQLFPSRLGWMRDARRVTDGR